MATSQKLPERSIKTVMGEINSTEAQVPGTYPIHPETTINTLYNVFPNKNDIVQSAPPLQYFGIGINGFYNTGDKIQGTPYQPKAREAGLYQPIPFRCVPIDQDLSAAERTNYRMRVEQSFNGNRYWCYYLKKLEAVDNSTRVVRIDPVTGEEAPYEFSTDYLTPTPVKPSVSGEAEGDVTEIVVTKRVRAVVTGSEVYEAINVMFEGDLTYAKISEWGLFTGVDATVTGYDAAGASFNYTEAIYAQLAYKLCNTGSGVHSVSWDGSRIFVLGNARLLATSL